MSIFAKLAGQHGVPVFEIVLVRSAIVAAFAVAKLCHDNQPGEPLLGHRRWLLLVRGVCGFGAGR
jgi:drug/metabolite transporter (DMT)-like permease